MKKLNSRGEELFLKAFKMWKEAKPTKKKVVATCVEGPVAIRILQEGAFTITTSSQRIMATAKPVVHEAFRDVFSYLIVVYDKKTKEPLFKTEWATFEMKAKVSLIKHR